MIYEVIEDIEQAVRGMLQPIYEERRDAVVEVRQIFRADGATRSPAASCATARSRAARSRG